MLEAVKAYIAATRFPKYERMDEVLFRLATQLTTAKKDEQARGFFQRLIKDYPTSKYIPDAYLAFAEHAFEGGEMEAALRFYEKVEQFPKSSVYPYAAYKKGWCHVNLGDYKTALETFVGVVRLTQTGKLAVDRRQLELLAKEAKKDVVKAYAQVGGADKARLFFAKVGGDYAPKMMELLAERYWEDGKALESTRVYKQIIADNMDEPARLRMAEQGAAQFAVAAELRQGAGDAGAGTPGPAACGRAGSPRAMTRGPSRNRRRSAGTRFTTRPASWR